MLYLHSLRASTLEFHSSGSLCQYLSDSVSCFISFGQRTNACAAQSQTPQRTIHRRRSTSLRLSCHGYIWVNVEIVGIVCTFCLHKTLRSSFPRVPPRIGNLHINPASPTQFWMRTPLFSTPILLVLPTLFRPRLELSASTVHISCLAHPLLRLLAFFPHHPTRLHPGPPTMQTTPQLTVAPASALLVSPSAPGSPER
ncbi:hypothetical protein B0H13DRAFT_2108056 [Mycena leptocephala]|nr:hypothetical protein B0H13DRAFT_2108056 [Mycena leptocephala]